MSHQLPKEIREDVVYISKEIYQRLLKGDFTNLQSLIEVGVRKGAEVSRKWTKLEMERK